MFPKKPNKYWVRVNGKGEGDLDFSLQDLDPVTVNVISSAVNITIASEGDFTLVQVNGNLQQYTRFKGNLHKLPLMESDQEKVRELVTDSKGRFFYVVFCKRGKLEVREMYCRTGVTKFLKGGKKAFDDKEKGLVTVWQEPDPERKGDTGYRSIPIENVMVLTTNKSKYLFGELPSAEASWLPVSTG